MKLRKILAAIAASAVAVSSMAVSAFAADGNYTATLGFADGTWAAQDWASTCEITGDGTYSITSNCLFTVIDEETGDEVQEAAAGAGIMVFVVDIAELGAELGINEAPEGATDEDDSWKYATGDVKVTDVKVTTGGTELAIDQANVKVGDIESKGNLRIEIYNEYGPTKEAPAIDKDAFAFAAEDQFTVTFTISGLGGAAAEDATEEVEEEAAEETTTEAPAAGDVAGTTDSSKGSPDTGIEDVAVVAGLAIVAGGAVLVSKKRK